MTCCVFVIVCGLCILSFAETKPGTNSEAEQHYEKANELYKIANYNDAITEFEQVIELAPKSAIAQNAKYWIGQLYFEIRQFDSALKTFQELIHEFPDSMVVSTAKTMIERVQKAKKTKLLFEAVNIKKVNIEWIKNLISEGADVNAKGSKIYSRMPLYNRTPLHIAAYRGNTHVVELLLSAGSNIEAKDDDGSTPLHLASWRGNHETVGLLISAGADVNVKDSEDVTPIFRAMTMVRSNSETVELLFKAGAKVPPLQMAAYRGNLQEIKRLLQEGSDIDSHNDFPATALNIAVASGQQEVAAFLINKGAAVNIEFLLLAVGHGHQDIANLLIAKGVDVNAKDSRNMTSLHYAAWNGHLSIAEMLISKGADINAKNNYGATPLITASSGRKKEMVKLLIAKGANVNAAQDNGYTTLFIEIRNGHKDIVELLLTHGANVNVKENWQGRTPLHEAAWGGKEDMVELLVTKGADINARTNANLTALDLAKQNDHTEIVEFLRKHGAKE